MLNIKNIKRSILRKSDLSPLPVFITGFSSIIIQCIFVREFLSVFFGNEIVLGVIFSVWLLFCGLGSLLGNRCNTWHVKTYTAFLILALVSGLFSIRFFPLFFAPGSVIPSAAVAFLLLIAEAPVSFLTGYAFGAVSRIPSAQKRVYYFENFGSLIGAGLVYAATLIGLANALITILALILLPVIIYLQKEKKSGMFDVRFIVFSLIVLIFAFFILSTDRKTASFKYAGPVSSIHYTREGEVAVLDIGDDTVILLNNTLYKSSLNKPVAEQAVHIPVAQNPIAKSALVIFDRGHAAELSCYSDMNVDIIETLPIIASEGSIITSPEKYRFHKKYDLIFLGTDMPVNTAESRFYTLSFFKRMRSIIAPGGVFSFTLPFNENYMPKNERQLYNILKNTLHSVFTHVLIFPGSGCATFMASEDSLFIPDKISIETDYLASYILPSLSDRRVKQANLKIDTEYINTTARPVALYYSLKNWMDKFGISAVMLLCLLLAVFFASFFILPRTTPVLSVSTSGLTTGIYSIAIMLLYQATYGSLYAEIALLLIALTLGFTLGSKCRSFPASDLIISFYVLISFLLLIIIPHPHVIFFLVCHFGMGFLSAAQFVSRKDTPTAILNTADLIGGVFGTALASTLLIPVFGIMQVAAGIFTLKIFAALFNLKWIKKA